VTAPRLTDGVVVLDAHTLDDVAVHLAGEDEEQARRFGWYPARSTEETVRATIDGWQREWSGGGDIRAFALRDAGTGELAGGCELRRQGGGRAEMSYWIFPPFRRGGYASRGVKLACEWAFIELGIERIDLFVEPDNLASRGVARRAGFAEAGSNHEDPETPPMLRYTRLRQAR